MMVDGIKVFLKNLLLALMEDKFLELRVEYAVDGFGSFYSILLTLRSISTTIVEYALSGRLF